MLINTLRLSWIPLALSLSSAACVVVGDADPPDEPGEPGEPGDPGDPQDICATEGRYDNGTCDTDCKTPDIDCFVVFESHAAAETWFTDFEAKLAAEQLREPRRIVSVDDPRYIKMREMLDRGWASYKTTVPVGKLTTAPELIVIEDPAVNAFATIDLATQKSAFVVMVQTGLLDIEMPDHELLGVTMHELAHVVGMHLVPGVKDRIRKHYQVLGPDEPFGFEQQNDEIAAEAITAWRSLASEASPYAYDALDGLPLNGTPLHNALRLAHRVGRTNDAAACARADEAGIMLGEYIAAHQSNFDYELDIAGQEQQLAALASAYTAALRDECLAGASFTIFDVLGQLFGATPEQVEQSFTPEDKALVADKHVVDAIRALTADRYQKMQLIEQALIDATGGDLSTLRYYSYEEAADDQTVPVLAGAGLPADGNADFLHSIMLPEDQTLCSEILAAGQVPSYGNLSDEHHGTCWRVWHGKKLASRETLGTLAARQVRRDVDSIATQRAVKMLREIHVPEQRLPVRSASEAMTSCLRAH